jgi:4a-hydroxytetrahydrobiopterin dehydratase
MTKLDDGDIEAWVAAHPHWRRDGGAIRRDVECSSFPAAIDLVNRIADVAEQRDHHPDIDIRWRTLHLSLSTHSEGGVTTKDLALAEDFDRLAAPAGSH